ncbi:MAG: M14-type cytosolic carboxypeptidase [Legionellales bacterium]|nr:M14-type cytosolic carboxypeptidase [Legionellales bacterium]
MRVSAPQDSGNIVVIDTENAQDIHLKIRPDNQARAYQWFYFEVEGVENESFVINIDNAGGASYPGWHDFGVMYRATASTDREHWSRLDTTYHQDSGLLTIQGQLVTDRMAIAFFPPYSYARHLKLIEKARTIPNCTVSSLGQSVEGRDLTLLTVGSPGANKKNIWVIARQHPGETMAEWYVEGLIDRLAQGDDLSEFFADAVLYIVPNMNPDGSYHGNLRTNALGQDLNRQWDVSDNKAKAPEVLRAKSNLARRDCSDV